MALLLVSSLLCGLFAAPVQEPAAAPALEPAAPPPAAPDLTAFVRTAGDLVPWIADPYRRYDLSRKNRGRVHQPWTPALDRSLLLDRALQRAKAAKRLVLVYAPRIEGRHMYRAPVVDDYMRLALFNDPELAALIRRRFVPLRLYIDEKVGRRLGAWNGDPNDPLFLKVVEPALFFVRPDGKVVHVVQRIRTFSAPWLRAVLLGVLKRNRKYAGPSALVAAAERAADGGSFEARVWLARQRILDGDEARALQELEALAAAQAKAAGETGGKRRRGGPSRFFREELTLARMQALRLLRRPAEALALRPQEPERAADFRREAMRCLAALGDWAGILAEGEPAPEDGEAWFYRGVAHYRRFEEDAAREAFRRAVAARVAPFDLRAAAMITASDDTTPFSPLAHDYEVFRLGPPELYVGLPASSERGRAPGNKAAREQQVRRALAFLLERQRPDGSWADTRYAYWSSPEILPNVRMAVTALAAASLLAWRDLEPNRIDEALARAETYLRDDAKLAPGRNEEVYSQAYRILYWLRRAAAGDPARRAEIAQTVAALVRRAAQIQDQKTGFFAHEYRNAFCTAAMLWSLHRARAAGIEVPPDVVELGVRALLSARRPDGSFSYGGSAAQRRGGSITANLKNASARMPLIESVLHVFGSSDRKKLNKAFEVFLEHLDKLARVRKCDFHSDGQLGGFFFWHAVFHASEAAGLLEPKLRRRVRKALFALVGSIEEIDGSFVDSHELGKSYGTAMALLTLANLEKL